MSGRFDDPSPDERFYAQALATLSGPRRRTATLMRWLNVAYWTAVILALAWFAAQAFDRTLPVAGRTQALIGDGAAPGAPLKVAYHVDRLKVCSADVSWTEIDGAGEMHRFGPKHIPVPGHAGQDSFIYPWPTSANATPGPSILRVALEFHCPGNYLQAFFPIIEELPDIAYDTLERTPP